MAWLNGRGKWRAAGDRKNQGALQVRVRRTVFHAVVAIAIVGSLGVSAPVATGADTYNITGANETAVRSPVVVLTNTDVRLSIVLGNRTATPKSATVTFDGSCWDSGYETVRIPPKTMTVTVPGDPDRYVKGVRVLKTVSATLRIPATCVPQGGGSPLASHSGQFYGNYDETGVTPARLTKLSFFWIGRAFTVRNYRYNLTLKTHREPANSQAHHTLPKLYEEWFRSKGINIHDPVHLRWWCSKTGVPGNHPSSATSYNKRWTDWKNAHGNASVAEILAFRDSIQEYYTYPCPGDRTYPGFP